MTTSQTVVIVTGASGNLGRAVLAHLARRPVRIVAIDRERAGIEDALADAGEGHVAHAGVDLTDPAAVQALIDSTLTSFGRVDGVVHTVGGFAYAPIAESDAALFERMFRLNVLTTVNVVRAALAPMRAAGRGSIVTVAAGAALKAPAGLAAYAAAKAGVLRLVESFADEAKAQSIRVNAVLPSIIDTPQNRADMPTADHAKWVKPETLASVIGFLLSDEAADITGAGIPVSGRV
jgi:NAD(P)-dependent dehydrogenase (short-subunit alcohol dehydrogenase family)